MKEFYRVMLGEGHIYAQECRDKGCISAGFSINQDLTHSLSEDGRDFNKEFIPAWMTENPGKSKIAAGRSCGFLYMICKRILIGDIILSPDGKGRYFVGEVESDYLYVPEAKNPHQRKVRWFGEMIDRSSMSKALKGTAGAMGTVLQISKYREELECLIKGEAPAATLLNNEELIDDPVVFAMEEHLETFLEKNWEKTPLGKNYEIFNDGENSGRQYEIIEDNNKIGRIDILAQSRDKKELLVVELKRGRASDAVVGQILRYMGYVQEVIAEHGQIVKGVIIALDDDKRLRWALKATQNIDFFRYEIRFDLVK